MHIRKFRKLTLSFLILIYLILELWSISLPALSDEETVAIIKAIQTIKRMGPFAHSIRIFNLWVPLVSAVPYHGATQSYLLLPFFLLFGIKVIILRLVEIALGVFIIVFTYFFLKDFFDIKVAITATLFLVINSTFLLHTKLGTGSASLSNFCATGAILCLWKWYQGRKGVIQYLGLFLLGLGLATVAWFVWFINAIIVLAIIFRRELLERAKGKAIKYIIIGLIFFLSGAFLILYYNFSTKFENINYIIKHFFQTRCSVNNLNYLGNLWQRMIVFMDLLSGSAFWREFPGKYGSKVCQYHLSFNSSYIIIFLFSYLSLISYLALNKAMFSRKRVSFVLLLFILIFIQTPFTLSNFCSAHLFILYPIIQTILGLALVVGFRVFSKNINMINIISCLFFVFVLLELDSTIENTYLHLKKTGGSGNISESIYSVSQYLKSRRLTKVVAMDWGIVHNIIFLSKGEIFPKTFPYIQDWQENKYKKEEFIREIKSLLFEQNVYLFRAPEFMNHKESYGIFKKVVNNLGKTLTTEKIFYQRDGRPSFYIYSVK